MASISSRSLLSDISGNEYPNRGQLEEAVIGIFRRRHSEIPSSYTPRQLLNWADYNQHILPHGRTGYRVELQSAH